MKTKLLKKVRKRFTIIKHVELASDASEELLDRKNKYGLPFFELKDRKQMYHMLGENFYRTFEGAREDIVNKVVRDYKEQFRHKNGKVEKVWWKELIKK